MTSSSLRERWRRSPGPPTELKPLPPVILMGMHRSGTTLVATLLGQAGLFTGSSKEHNAESTFFIGLNNWLLAQGGCRWDEPERWEERVADPELRRIMVEQMRHLMKVRPVMEFVGREAFKRGIQPFKLERPWGWKDPRNTITLPVWLEVFPEARVVCVERHGLDVAASLHRRSRAELNKWPGDVDQLPGTLVTDSARCLTMHGAFDMWVSYMAAARRQAERLGARLLTVRYETLMEQPAPQLRALADFCGLKVSDAALAGMVASMKPERAYAFRQGGDMDWVDDAVRASLAAYGYAA